MEPKVRVEQDAVQRGATLDRWQVRWRIENLGQQPLKIIAARAPHGKFRCEETKFTPAVDLGPNQRGRMELEVRCGEPSGTVVENAFLIMRVLWAGSRWLILVRFRVSVNGEGAPTTMTELITTQPVGFSLQRADS